MENIQHILEQTVTKTAKIKMLLQLGMTRKQVAEAMGVGYGFVQNVYASVYGVARPRKFHSETFSFDRTFGVEMEIIHESESKIRSAIRNAGVECEIEGYNHDTRTHWKIVSDASVDGGFEVVSPVLKGRDGLDELEKVCNALVSAGARIRKCCGLHVHLGTDDFKTDIRVWKNLYKNYAALERTIDSFMPPSRRHNQYLPLDEGLRLERQNRIRREFAYARKRRDGKQQVFQAEQPELLAPQNGGVPPAQRKRGIREGQKLDSFLRQIRRIQQAQHRRNGTQNGA